MKGLSSRSAHGGRRIVIKVGVISISKFVAFLKDESGASAAEYVLILGLVGLAIVVGATALGTALNAKFNAAATAL